MFKAWNKRKKQVEDNIINELHSAFTNGGLDTFENVLQREVPTLRQVYVSKPDAKNDSAEKDLLRNHVLKELFATILQTDNRSEYIKAFLSLIPVVNDDLKYTVKLLESRTNQVSSERSERSRISGVENTLERNERLRKPIVVTPTSQRKQTGKPLHVAIRAKAFHNVAALLEIDGIDVNAECKSTRHTPLVMLFAVATSENSETVKELVNKLAEKGANINLGFYQTHPLSVLCAQKNISLIRHCMALFDCDIDILYKGKTRKDLREVGIAEEDIRHVPAQIDCSLLETFLTAGNEDEFIKNFKQFYGPNQPLDEVYRLLEYSALKGRHRSVKTIFEYLRGDVRYYQFGKSQQIRLSRQLRHICKSGYSKVLELFLDNIKSRIENKRNPVLLICVKELFKSRTPERLKCFQLVINDRRISAEKCDHQKQTALHFAVQHRMDEEVRCIMVKRSPYLGTLNNESETPLHRMKKDDLKFFLDSRVSKQNENEIHLDLKGLIPPKPTAIKKWHSKKWPMAKTDQEDGIGAKLKEDSIEPEFLSDKKPEIDVFFHLSSSEKLHPLIGHPVISTCLHIKWLFLRWIVYLLIVLNLAFTISFSVYTQWNSTIMRNICTILVIYYIFFYGLMLSFDENVVKLCRLISNVRTKSADNPSQTQATSDTNARTLEEETSSIPLISSSPEQTPTTKPDTPESTQSDWKPLRCPRWMNPFYLLHMLIPPAIIFLATASLWYNNRTALAGVILLSGIDNIIHFKMIPWTTLSASIIMLETVSRSLLKILLSYLIPLLSFGVSFHVLLSDNGDSSGNSFDAFSTLIGTLVKIVAMMMGEFNAQDIPFSKHQLSYPIFLLFVFLVSMVIMNLVNALAVSDVTVRKTFNLSYELRHNAELDTIASWIKLLYRFENVYSLSFSSFFNRYEPKVIIKTDKDNMIQLIRVKEPKPVGEVHISMVGQQQTKKKVKPTAETTGLRIFPVLKFGHSLHPDVCYALEEIAAENSLQKDVPKYKWDKRAKHGKAKTRQMAARRNWAFAFSNVMKIVKNGRNSLKARRKSN